MEKRIGAFEARRQLGKVLEEVANEGNSYVVERNGEPVAAVVPIALYEQWQKERGRFFDWLGEAVKRSVTPEEEEANRIAVEVVREVRAEEARKASREQR